MFKRERNIRDLHTEGPIMYSHQALQEYDSAAELARPRGGARTAPRGAPERYSLAQSTHEGRGAGQISSYIPTHVRISDKFDKSLCQEFFRRISINICTSPGYYIPVSLKNSIEDFAKFRPNSA